MSQELKTYLILLGSIVGFVVILTLAAWVVVML